MFLPDDSLKATIMRELEKDDRSISSLYRTLLDDGFKIHRLVLTGYLKAMEDMRVLKAKEIPPSKVYSISLSAAKDIYQSIGEYCRNMDVPDQRRPAIGLYVMQKLFRRPVFLGEMRRAGFTGDIEEIAVGVSSEERLEAKKMLAKRGHKLPQRDPAYRINKKYDKEFDEIIPHLLLQRFEASSLAVDTKQTTLGM
jgi:DNA-binding HxlR family transcriptional regulator